MDSLAKMIKSIQISIGGFERPEKVFKDHKGVYPPMGVLENIRIEKTDDANLSDVYFEYLDFTEFYPKAKIEKIIYTNGS